MLNIDFIRQHPAIVREGLHRRRDPHNIDELLRLAEQRRGLVTRCDGLYNELKPLKETARTLPQERRPELNKSIKATTQDIRQLELQIVDIDTRLQPLLLSLPNLPHQSVKDGDDECADYELRRWGEALPDHFEPRSHWELGERLGIIDFESGARIAGSRFVTLKGAGARLERALISFMLDLHTQEHGYTEIMPPSLVRRSIMVGAGQLPKFEDQVYACPEDELFLNPTAEVPLVGVHSDSILPASALPVRYVAWTTAYRREAGSASRQTRGLLRLHQFNKVELFQLTEPQASYDALEQMLGHAEAVLRHLELPYRVMALCAANLPFAAAKTIDLEVWMPAQGRYTEISSVSNCEAFQARRANIKYRPTNSSRAEYVHTLNASGLAVGRTMAALLETYQQADGTVVIPKVLRPYMGASLLSS
ncbi:MAG TPA: serine--tRNA ligase [Ktedonobacteraceae bacterium]|nr:serine--tRNA ligase [Ktedonobacteraceae bacterium]